MWIAKPLQSLSGAERAAWISMQELGRGDGLPLSQTLAWGDAIIALGGRAYLVFSPEERVGGLVHHVQGGYECINGPCLHWDNPADVARQFATFVMAVTRLGADFSSIRVQPRWPLSMLDARLRHLPIPPREVSQASTMQVSVRKTESESFAAVTPRLRRALSVTRRAGVEARTLAADIDGISAFAQSMRAFGRKKGFYVPDESWLQSLVRGDEGARREDLRFFITEARTTAAQGTGSAVTKLLTCVHGETAHYLFGFDERDDLARASISTSAVAHFHVLEQCAALGVRTYDLNGYTDPADHEHPYSGVSRFKAQFQGEIVNYASPLFWIEG